MKLTVLLLTLSLSLFLAACGDDDDDPPTSETTTLSATPESDDTPVTPRGTTDPYSIVVPPDPARPPALLVDVRVGAHDGFDRIVFEFDAAQPSGLIEYRDDVAQCGSGEPVDPAGAAALVVRFIDTNAHTEAGAVSVPSLLLTGPGTSILAAESICDFEAVVEWAVGTDGEKPFTVTLLDDPNRVVIDVAH